MVEKARKISKVSIITCDSGYTDRSDDVCGEPQEVTVQSSTTLPGMYLNYFFSGPYVAQ